MGGKHLIVWIALITCMLGLLVPHAIFSTDLLLPSGLLSLWLPDHLVEPGSHSSRFLWDHLVEPCSSLLFPRCSSFLSGVRHKQYRTAMSERFPLSRNVILTRKWSDKFCVVKTHCWENSQEFSIRRASYVGLRGAVCQRERWLAKPSWKLIIWNC